MNSKLVIGLTGVLFVGQMLTLSSCKKDLTTDAIGGDKARDTSAIVNNDEYAYLQAKSLKRGLGQTFQLESQVEVLAPGVTWDYNWGDGSKSNFYNSAISKKFDACGIEYVPMCWSGVDETGAAIYAKNHPTTKHILGFNEPNLKGQAQITPQEAVTRWETLRKVANANGLTMISPSMTYGNIDGWSGVGTKWLDEFFRLLGTDKAAEVKAIGVHVYQANLSTAISDLKKYYKYNKPVWLTEFCAWNSGQHPSAATAQMTFMSKILNYMEQESKVERYAWFIAKGGYSDKLDQTMYLITASGVPQLTDLGKVYVYMSTFDKTVKYPLNVRIPAEHYQACSVAEDYNSVEMEPSTDKDGYLSVKMNVGCTADYYITSSAKKMAKVQVRYSAIADRVLSVYTVDGSGNAKLLTTINAPTTGSRKWATAESNAFELPSGDTTIRLSADKANFRINWIDIIASK